MPLRMFRYIGAIIVVMVFMVACADPEQGNHEIGPSPHTSQEVESTADVTRLVEPPVEVPSNEVPRQTELLPDPATATTSEPNRTSGPTPSPSNWAFFEGPYHPVTGGKSHALRTTGQVISPVDYSSVFLDPWLFLRCDGGILESYVTWGSRSIAANPDTETIPTVYRIDDASPVHTNSDESVNHESSFFIEPGKFVRDLSGSEKVVIRVTHYDDTEMTAVFPTTGLDVDLSKLTCWP